MTEPALTMNDCFDRYERSVLPTHEPRTQHDYRRHLKKLRKTFGHKLPSEVTSRDVANFLDVETGRIHRNRIVAVLSTVFQKMVHKWHVHNVNPCVGVERNETKPRDRYITDAEFALIRSVMPERVQIAMDLALLTGQRQGDLLALRWDHITPQGISFRQSKTGKRLRISLSLELKRALGRAYKLSPETPREYVLRTKSGSRYTSEGFRALWQRRMRKLMKGYFRKPRGKQAIWHEPRLALRATFHDIRAKCVSDSPTLEDAFERAGHTDMSMTRSVYDRAEREVKPLK